MRPRPSALRLALAVPAVALVAAPAAVGVSAASAAALPSSFVSTRNVLPGLANATDLGPTAAARPMQVVVGVSRPDPAGEQRFIHDVTAPGTSDYRHFLTPATFAQRFGVAPATRQAATSWLTSDGMHLDSVSAAGDTYAVSGSAAQVAATFRTTLHDFTTGGTRFVANTASPLVPSAVPVSTVVGLNTLQHFTTPSRSTPSSPKPAQDTCVGATCTGLTTPQDLWSVYQQPSGYRGAGQQLAVLGEGATDGVIADLRTFEGKFGLPQMPVDVVHPAGDTTFSDTSGSEEWDIDTQASSGMAPDASNLRLYFGQDLSDQDVLKLISQWTDDTTGPKQANASFGECETNPTNPVTGGAVSTLPLPVGEGLGNNLQPLSEAVLAKAVSYGKTLFASTGDTGSSCPAVYAAVIGAGNGVLNQGAPLTNYPASSPYVTAVGGTVLYTDGKGARTSEYAWTFGGGGSTLLIKQPDYQQGVAGDSIPCVTDASGTPYAPGTPCRGIPDVSAQSGDIVSNGYSIIAAGQPSQGAGTSLSSPLWEGMWARVQGAQGGDGLGFANPSLYEVGKDPAANARDYFDVTTGSNGLYTASTGWDYTTGWGTPKVGGLITDLTGH